MPRESISAASDVSVARFGLRIIRAMQPSAARGETAECVAEQLYAGNRLRRVLLAQSERLAKSAAGAPTRGEAHPGGAPLGAPHVLAGARLFSKFRADLTRPLEAKHPPSSTTHRLLHLVRQCTGVLPCRCGSWAGIA